MNNNKFIENNYFPFLSFKCLKNETQETLTNFCTLYLDYYNGTTQDNLEALKILVIKYMQESNITSIFLTVTNNNLKINVFETNINFTKINDDLTLISSFINNFKTFLAE